MRLDPGQTEAPIDQVYLLTGPRGIKPRRIQLPFHNQFRNAPSSSETGWHRSNQLQFQLEKPLVYGTRVRPILLAPIADHYAAGSKAMVTGWGVMRNNGPLATRLRKVQVPLVSSAQCSRLYVTRPITRRMICAGYVDIGGKDSCQVINCFHRRELKRTKVNFVLTCDSF